MSAVQTILAGESGQITIRHLFYRLEGLRIIEKTDRAYKSLGSHLTKWRRDESVAWDAFSDSTRWHYGTIGDDDALTALENTADCYRKNLWAEQPIYLEIWSEKDAIASILVDVAQRFGVYVFVCRGFSSLTSLYNAAATFREKAEAGKQAHILYFGDHDPSGVLIDRKVSEAFEEFGVSVAIERMAVTRAQIEEFDLPTRPPKAGDTRARGWVGGCVEIDAMRPATIRQLLEQSITKHIEPRRWNELKRVEQMERDTLRQLCVQFQRESDG